MKQNCQKKKLELEIKINYIMTNVNIYEDHKVTTNAWLIQAELYQRCVYYDRREEESGRGGERKAHTCMVACSLARSQVRTNALKTPPPPTPPHPTPPHPSRSYNSLKSHPFSQAQTHIILKPTQECA